MWQHRARRERELSSLYATARALTALGEVDAVLASIVRHAHDLIGADVTYLSVLDESGDSLKLHAAEGALSPAFRTAQVPTTTGVAGRILETGAPFWVSDYLSDTTLEHDERFDRIASDEGLVALLGVPLRDSDSVFGMLFVGERVERPFAMDEVALLSAFADHAAVALLNARLYDESRRALAEVQEAYASMERSAHVHEALTQVVLTGGGASEVAELLVDDLGGRVSVYDRDDAPVVTTGAVSLPAPPRERLRSALADSRATGRSMTLEVDSESHCVVAMLAGDAYLGAVVLSDRRSPSDVERHILERGAQILSLLTLKQNAVVEAEERVRGELLTELVLAQRPFADELRTRAAARGLDVDRINAVAVVESQTLRSAELARRLHAMSPEWSGIAGDYFGTAVMLLHADDPEQAAQDVHRRLRSSLRQPVLVCAAPVAEAADGLRRPFDLAARSVRVLRGIGAEDRGMSTARLAMYSILFDPERDGELRGFIEEQLGALLGYDSRRGTELVKTLSRYFDSAGNLTRAARELHVHMNTLVKRMDRIGRLLGEQWRAPHRALELEVAVRLHTLSEAEAPRERS